ncbi:MAG: response regulator [Cyanobacteria bacterium CRU_2_1]|nr:response regulator [Cyanobacteria bacterium RU_5_0]NJR63794.1 response regulator [Cyanobacteria bacterium CRU_2_1]
MVVASSADQAMAKAKQSPPSLIILSGNQQDWSQTLISRLRTIANHSGGIMIVALTDSHAPSWLRQEENPGLDGFLVKPLNGDVLTSLVQSAWARQTYMPYPGISG